MVDAALGFDAEGVSRCAGTNGEEAEGENEEEGGKVFALERDVAEDQDWDDEDFELSADFKKNMPE